MSWQIDSTVEFQKATRVESSQSAWTKCPQNKRSLKTCECRGSCMFPLGRVTDSLNMGMSSWDYTLRDTTLSIWIVLQQYLGPHIQGA